MVSSPYFWDQENCRKFVARAPGSDFAIRMDAPVDTVIAIARKANHAIFKGVTFGKVNFFCDFLAVFFEDDFLHDDFLQVDFFCDFFLDLRGGMV